MREPTRGRSPASGLVQRGPRVKVKAKGRSVSSKAWLERQLNDPYVKAAKAKGYRSRAAFKLAEMDERFALLKRGVRVLDLGAAPGGWAQVAAERGARVLAVDLTPIDPIAGVTVLTLDFLGAGVPEQIKAAAGGPFDLVLSDMAAPATGHRQTDHLKIMALCEAALDFALETLAPGGAFLAKVQRGGTEHTLLARMKRHFRAVRHVKPAASRADSAEMYVLATDFRGPSTPHE